jgi:DNA-binding protein H-NS
MKFDLKSLNRKELEKLLEDVKKALLNAQARDRRIARKAAEKAAAEYGFSLGDLTDDAPANGKARKQKKKVSGPKAPPKFANPADKSQTWTGKGRQPNWYRAELANGNTPENMEI